MKAHLKPEINPHILELIHLARAKCDGMGLLIVFRDDAENPTNRKDVPDKDVGEMIALVANTIMRTTRMCPSLLPIVGKIPDGTPFPGERFALKIIDLNEALAEHPDDEPGRGVDIDQMLREEK